MTPVPRWPYGSSPPATDASSACSTARTNYWHSPVPCASPTSPRCRGRPSTDPTTSHWSRVRSPPPRTPSGSGRSGPVSRRLITIGACASAGGIQALRNFAAEGAYVGAVYAHPEYISSLSTSTPISAHVAVDLEVQGCPIDRHQLLEVITATLVGRKPVLPGAHGLPGMQGEGHRVPVGGPRDACLGPVTRAAAAPCARPSAVAASVASDRRRGRTPTPWPGASWTAAWPPSTPPVCLPPSMREILCFASSRRALSEMTEPVAPRQRGTQ